MFYHLSNLDLFVLGDQTSSYSVRDRSGEPNIYVSWSTSEIRVRLVPSNMFKSFSNFLIDRSKTVLFCRSFLLFVSRVWLCYTVLSVPCRFVVTWWERVDLLALLCVMFSCVCVIFPQGDLVQMWYLIVSIPDLCILRHFKYQATNSCGIMTDLSFVWRDQPLTLCTSVWKHLENLFIVSLIEQRTRYDLSFDLSKGRIFDYRLNKSYYMYTCNSPTVC